MTPPRPATHYDALTDAQGEALIRHARAHGLYAHDCPELTRLLAQVNLDADIPPPLYQAVAELLVWLHQLVQDEPHP